MVKRNVVKVRRDVLMDKKAMVAKFHEVYGTYMQDNPDFPNQNVRDLRIKLLQEEFDEYLLAEKDDHFIEVCDALGDMLYIIYGTCVSYGIPINEIFQEIHNSNMSKLDENGKPIVREDGKILKGPNYFKTDIKGIISRN